MASYDLSHGLQDSFSFSANIQGKKQEYTVKYPSQKELEPITRGYLRLEGINNEIVNTAENSSERKALEDEVTDITTKMTEAFTNLFTPVNDSMPISEFLETIPLNVKREFDRMVQTEFGTNDKK